jgi:hypothetical protein
MALAGLRKGTEEITRSAESNSGSKFTPFIGWKDGDVKLIYFLTEPEEIPKLKLHSFVEFPTEDGTRYDTLVCRKDPAFRDEYGGECELCDRVGMAATEKFVALAIELEAVKSGKTIKDVKVAMRQFKDREGNDREVPQIGLVIQASRNFFAPYVAWESRKDLTETSFEVERQGASTDTKYFFFPVDAKPDLSEIEVPSLEEVLERLASDDKYEAVAELAPGSQKSWGDNKKTSSGKAGSKPQSEDMRSQFERIAEEVNARKSE